GVGLSVGEAQELLPIGEVPLIGRAIRRQRRQRDLCWVPSWFGTAETPDLVGAGDLWHDPKEPRKARVVSAVLAFPLDVDCVLSGAGAPRPLDTQRPARP